MARKAFQKCQEHGADGDSKLELGVLMAIDWLEPCVGCQGCRPCRPDSHDADQELKQFSKSTEVAKILTERIMKRQIASFSTWNKAAKAANCTNIDGEMSEHMSLELEKESCIMILPRHAARIHVLAPRDVPGDLPQDVKISEMLSLSFKTHCKMVSWFRQATKLLDTHEHRIHIIASVHTPVIQLRQGIQQIQTNPQLSGFWIHEDKAIRADSRSLKPKVSSSQVMEDIRKLGLGPTSNFTFLVALNAVESLGQEFGYHTLSRVKAAIAAAKARFAHEAKNANKAIGANQNVPSPSRHARWDRTLSGAVNLRRKATKAEMETTETTETTETEHICDAAAQMFLSWRRRKRMHQLPESEHATLGMKFICHILSEAPFLLSEFPHESLCSVRCQELVSLCRAPVAHPNDSRVPPGRASGRKWKRWERVSDVGIAGIADGQIVGPGLPTQNYVSCARCRRSLARPWSIQG